MDVGKLAEELKRQAMRDPRVATYSIQDTIIGFFHAVNWSETWILGLLLFHALFFIIACFWTRGNQSVAITLFAIGFPLVALSKYINEYASLHWKSFSTQNYFDRHGVFISIMLSGPILFNIFIVLVSNPRPLPLFLPFLSQKL